MTQMASCPPQASSPLADASTPLYTAPRFTPVAYPSWDAFSAALDAYMDQTFQLYICKTSTSSACRNQRMAKTHNLNSGDKALIPSEIKFYSKTMVCTHAGVRTSRGKGIRAKQSNRAMGCPAKINVLTKKISGRDNSKASGWKVLVTQHTAMHNHPLDKETYLSYPQNRRVENPVVLEAVNALRNAGVKQGKIRKYITEKEPTKHVTRSDVNNLLQKMKDDNFLANMQRAIQSGLPNATSRPTVGGDEGETGLADTEMPFEREGDLVGAAESARDSAASAGAPAAPSNKYFAASAGAEHASRSGMPEPAATTRQVEESISFVEPTTADFTLRSSNKVRQPSLAVAQRNDVGENDATSLQGLYDSEEISSGSFKLRVQRLEEQNLALFRQNSKLVEQNQQHVASLSGVRAQNAALYAQNTKLVEQNRQHVADLAEAQKSVSDAQRQLIALRASGVKMSETVSALTQEVAMLRAEKAEWKQQDHEKDTTIAPDSTEPQITCGSHPRVDEQDGVSQDPVQMPKRALESSDSNSESELERPQKRASTQEKCTARVP